MVRYKLPIEVRNLIHARNRLRERYASSGLNFTLDGNLVGDLGEAIAAELFDLKLVPRRGQKGVDAVAVDGRTVQIKATGRGQSFAFTSTNEPADWMIGLILYYDVEEVEIVYNGPYSKAVSELVAPWPGQKPERISKLRRWNAMVADNERLVPIRFQSPMTTVEGTFGQD